MPEGIDKIILKNFKAFPEEEIIELNGKHLFFRQRTKEENEPKNILTGHIMKIC